MGVWREGPRWGFPLGTPAPRPSLLALGAGPARPRPPAPRRPSPSRSPIPGLGGLTAVSRPGEDGPAAGSLGVSGGPLAGSGRRCAGRQAAPSTGPPVAPPGPRAQVHPAPLSKTPGSRGWSSRSGASPPRSEALTCSSKRQGGGGMEMGPDFWTN